MGYENPLAKLGCTALVQALPAAERKAIGTALRMVRMQANALAEESWRRNLVRDAVYWRPVSTYARHAAHLMAMDMPRSSRSAKTPPATSSSLDAPCAKTGSDRRAELAPVLGLEGMMVIRSLSPASRTVLAQVLLALSRSAAQDSTKSWRQRKSPMAQYWREVWRHARCVARWLVSPSLDRHVPMPDRSTSNAAVGAHRAVGQCVRSHGVTSERSEVIAHEC